MWEQLNLIFFVTILNFSSWILLASFNLVDMKVHKYIWNDDMQDGRISYEEFAAMMKAGTDWRKASRQYSRERFNSLSLKLMRDGSLQMGNNETK